MALSNKDWEDIRYQTNRYVEKLEQENERLKKRIEEITRIGLADHKYASEKEDEAVTLQLEKQELIEWLKQRIKETTITTEENDYYLGLNFAFNEILNKLEGKE